jgi:maltoporin
MADIKDIIEKLDKMDSRIDNIDITLAKQNVTLEEHVRRSEANEETLEIVKNEADVRLRNLESYKDKVLGAFAILGILGTLAVGIKELGFF